MSPLFTQSRILRLTFSTSYFQSRKSHQSSYQTISKHVKELFVRMWDATWEIVWGFLGCPNLKCQHFLWYWGCDQWFPLPLGQLSGKHLVVPELLTPTCPTALTCRRNGLLWSGNCKLFAFYFSMHSVLGLLSWLSGAAPFEVLFCCNACIWNIHRWAWGIPLGGGRSKAILVSTESKSTRTNETSENTRKEEEF